MSQVRVKVLFGFSFAFDWLKGRYMFSGPVTGQCKAKTKQSCFTFDIQL